MKNIKDDILKISLKFDLIYKQRIMEVNRYLRYSTQVLG